MSQRQDQCLFLSVHLYVHVALAKFFRSLCSFLEINMKEERGKVIMVSTVRPHCKQTSLQKARENSQQRDSGRNFEENDSNLERKYLFLPLILIIDPVEKKEGKETIDHAHPSRTFQAREERQARGGVTSCFRTRRSVPRQCGRREASGLTR